MTEYIDEIISTSLANQGPLQKWKQIVSQNQFALSVNHS